MTEKIFWTQSFLWGNIKWSNINVVGVKTRKESKKREEKITGRNNIKTFQI